MYAYVSAETSVFEFHFKNSCCSDTVRWILLKFAKFTSEKMIIKAAKRIFNSDKICRSYSDLNFGVTFLEHSVVRCDIMCAGAPARSD